MNKMNFREMNIEDTEAPTRRAFLFLRDHSRTPEAFTKDEFKNFANYPNPDNFDTYFSKKFRHLLEPDPNDQVKFLVSGIFKKFSNWEKFRAYFSQSSKIKANYIEEYFKKLMIFEFFMPLTNENDLRSSLDEVFIRIQLNYEESDVLYMERICDWISKRFGGYSIGTVRGRFKVGDLKTFAEVALLREKGEDYIIDETTAIVRFIFYLGESIKKKVSFDFEQFNEDLNNNTLTREMLVEANQIRFIFKNLFVKSIQDMVNGEEEIWMLESGINNRLYIWKNEVNQ
jgi:hypothetical protein